MVPVASHSTTMLSVLTICLVQHLHHRRGMVVQPQVALARHHRSLRPSGE